jgi:hypothetical protein
MTAEDLVWPLLIGGRKEPTSVAGSGLARGSTTIKRHLSEQRDMLRILRRCGLF